MDPKDLLKNTIPNPISGESTTSDLAKKGEILQEGLSFSALFNGVVFLLILAVVLISYFKVSVHIVALLIGTEILMAFIAGYIKIRKLRSLYKIETRENARSYRKIVITSEYYEFIKAIFAFIASIISVTLVFLLFSKEISDFVGSNVSVGIPINGNFLKYLVFAFVIFRLFEFVLRSIRYGWIKNLKESDDLAQVNQEYVLIEKKLQLIKFLPMTGVILLFLFLIGAPIYFSYVLVALMFFMIILSVAELLRIKNVQFDDNKIDESVVKHKIEEYKDEKIAGAVFGIMRSAVDIGDIFKPFGTAVLGAGKSQYPENTLLVTDRRLLFVQVPVSGGNKIVGETDYVTQNFYYNRGEIRQKGEELLKTGSLTGALDLAIDDITYEDILVLTLKKAQIIIEKVSGEKVGYVFMDKGYTDLFRQLLSPYLKEKFVDATGEN